MNSLTPRDLRLMDLAHAAWQALSFGTFAALAITPFIEHGRFVAALIGG